VFYAVAIIITAYLPIFTLQRVEGRLFKPMAWTVAFALLGAIIFSLLIAPALASLFFPKGTREWHNPVMTWLTNIYRRVLRVAIRCDSSPSPEEWQPGCGDVSLAGRSDRLRVPAASG
jgi:heavy metal efflux system protein